MARTNTQFQRIQTLETLLKRKRDLQTLMNAVSECYQTEYGTPFGRLLELVTMETVDQLGQI